MRITNALQDRKARRIGIIAALVIAVILPVIQTGFLQNSVNAWFLTLVKSPLNTFLYLSFSVLFGMVISLQVYIKRNPKVCIECNTKKGTRTGVIGTFLGFFVGVCPACIGLLGLIFPLGASLTLTYYGWIFMLIAIGMMVLSIYLLGGFKKE